MVKTVLYLKFRQFPAGIFFTAKTRETILSLWTIF